MLPRPGGQRLAPIPMSHHRGIEYWSEKLASHPENGRAHRNLAPLMAERAARGQKGAKEAVMTHLKHAVHYDPGSDAARNDLGVALLNAGNTVLAIAQFEAGLKSTPSSAMLHKNLAAAYARTGAFKKALLHAHEASRFAPLDPQAHRNLAKLYDASGNTRDSLHHNRMALRLGPGKVTEGRVRDRADAET